MRRKIIFAICFVTIFTGVITSSSCVSRNSIEPLDYKRADNITMPTVIAPFQKELGGSTSNYTVINITTITPPGGVGNYGGQMDWSPDGAWITYDVQGEDGFTDVYKMRPDGTDNECLTCDNPILPNRHQGQSTWHPSGRYLVFQAEKSWH